MSVIDYTYVDKVTVDSNDNTAVEGGGMIGHGGQDQESVHNLKLLIFQLRTRIATTLIRLAKCK